MLLYIIIGVIAIIIFVKYKNRQEERIGAAAQNPQSAVDLYQTHPQFRSRLLAMADGNHEALRILESLAVISRTYPHVDLNKFAEVGVKGNRINLLFNAANRDMMKLAMATASYTDLNRLVQMIEPAQDATMPINTTNTGALKPRTSGAFANAAKMSSAKRWVLNHRGISGVTFGVTTSTELTNLYGVPKKVIRHSPFTYAMQYDSIIFLSDVSSSSRIVGVIANIESNMSLESATELIAFDKPTDLTHLRNNHFQWTIPDSNADALRKNGDTTYFRFVADDGYDTKHVVFQTTTELLHDNLGHSRILAIELYTIDNNMIPA